VEIVEGRSGLRLIDHGFIRLDHTVQDVDDVGIHDTQASPVDAENPLITPAARLEIRDTDEADADAISQGALAIAVLVEVSGDSSLDETVYSLNGRYIIGGTTLTADGGAVRIAGFDASLGSNGLAIAGQTFAPTDAVQGSPASSALLSPNAASAGSAPTGASVLSGGSAPSGALAPSGGSAPSGALAPSGGSAPSGASGLSAGSAPTGGSVTSISLPASLPTLGSGSDNGSFVAPPPTTAAAVKQVATAFAQFSDQSVISNEAPDVKFSLPLAGILVGVFVILLV
jgi:hypothetical protein